MVKKIVQPNYAKDWKEENNKIKKTKREREREGVGILVFSPTMITCRKLHKIQLPYLTPRSSSTQNNNQGSKTQKHRKDPSLINMDTETMTPPKS